MIRDTVREDYTHAIGDLDPNIMSFYSDLRKELPLGEYEVNTEICKNFGCLYLDIMPNISTRYEKGDITIEKAYKILDEKYKRVEEMIPEELPFMAKLKIEDVLEEVYREAKKELQRMHEVKNEAKDRMEKIRQGKNPEEISLYV